MVTPQDKEGDDGELTITPVGPGESNVASVNVEDLTGTPPEAGSSEAAPVHVDEVPHECEVCGEEIPSGQDYIEAAYGPVHIEPCSHQGKVGPGIPQLGV